MTETSTILTGRAEGRKAICYYNERPPLVQSLVVNVENAMYYYYYFIG